MRDAENIRAVEKAGPDWMGFICWQKSSRHVCEIPSYLPRCTRVGVFVNADIWYIQEMILRLGLNRIQLHGMETPDQCREIALATGLPVIKAINVLTREDVKTAHAYEGIVDYILFDTKCKCVGGSGEQFDWDILYAYQGNTPFILAGGIGPGDEERVRGFTHSSFAGIDLNSRFELSPALKDANQLEIFIRNILS